MTVRDIDLSDDHSMVPKFVEVLNERTLQARHFSEIHLSHRQLHVWCEKTGFEPDARPPGKWRNFSPAEVLRLATLKELKGRTGIAITSHQRLVEFIGDDARFLVATVEIAMERRRPWLLTDLDHYFEVVNENQCANSEILSGSPFWCMLSLTGAFRLMLSAIANGRSIRQRRWLADLSSLLVDPSKQPEPVPQRPVRDTKTTEAETIVKPTTE